MDPETQTQDPSATLQSLFGMPMMLQDRETPPPSQGMVSSPSPQPASTPSPAQAFIDNNLVTPQELLMQRLHGGMSQKDWDASSKGHKVGTTAKNVLLGLLTGINPIDQSREDYEQLHKMVSTSATEVRNEDLARRAQATLQQAGQFKALADQRQQEKNAIAQQLADTKQQIADDTKAAKDKQLDINKRKTEIADLAQKAKAGDMLANQQLHTKLADFKIAHPELNTESLLADAMTGGDLSKLDIPTFVKHMAEMKQATTPPQLKDFPTFNGAGVQTGVNVTPINKFTGQVQGGLPGSASPTSPAGGAPPSTPPPSGTSIPFGQQPNGAFLGSKDMMKNVASASKPRDTAMTISNSLLQDLGTGAINKYTGPLWGNPTVAKWRSMIGLDTSGEDLKQRLDPQQILGAVRELTGGRMNLTEVKAMTSAMGGNNLDGESVTRRALFSGLISDMALEKAKGQDFSTLVTNPTFTAAMREVVENAVAAAKKTKGAFPVPAPTISDVMKLASEKAAASAAAAQKGAQQTFPDDVAAKRKKYQ